MGSCVRFRGAVAVALLTLAALVLTAAPASAAGRYKVQSGGIVDLGGRPFVLRAAGALDGYFVGTGHAIDAKAVRQARKEFRSMKNRGLNGVRLQVQGEGITAERLAGLRKIVAQARVAGLVTVISNVDSSPAATLELMRSLARSYRNNPLVWLQPLYEPNCSGQFADPTRCESWTVWRAEQTNYLKAIRNGGMRSPVLVGTPRLSADAGLVLHYRLADRNVVYGVHVDAGAAKEFGAAQRTAVEKAIAPAGRRLAVVYDNLARVGGSGQAAGPDYTRRAVAYLANWVVYRGGDGAIVGTWHPGGPNSLATARGGLTTYGGVVSTRFIALAQPSGSAEPGKLAPRAELRYGDTGYDVRAMQQDMADLGYLAAKDVSGSYGYATEQGIMAFQGYERIGRDGVAGTGTRARLGVAVRPVAGRAGPAHVEISLDQQVLLMVENGGRVRRAIHVSSGAGGRTPRGDFHVFRKEQMSWSIPFKVWMPWASYIVGGIAMHQYSSVPSYPASHGCVRMPSSEATTVYAFAGYGMPVWVH